MNDFFWDNFDPWTLNRDYNEKLKCRDSSVEEEYHRLELEKTSSEGISLAGSWIFFVWRGLDCEGPSHMGGEWGHSGVIMVWQ